MASEERPERRGGQSNSELTLGDARMLLLLGQAIGQEQYPWRTAVWVTEGVTSLLGASLAAVVLNGLHDLGAGARTVYGEMAGSPCPTSCAST